MKRGIGVVNTHYGAVSGVEKNGITEFRGIPYAKAPVGELRWRAPEKPESWDGVRVCDKFGPVCPQLRGQCDDFSYDYSVQDEDCLYLNIWTPAQTSGEKLPVLVWIHGGAFLGGMGSDGVFQGWNMASRGIIEVSINYRLGVLGFFAHSEFSAESEHHVSGNYGLMDQVAALKWVRENIAAFGGDPAKITIAGQSAGGMSVCSMLTTPLSAGLISGAVIESGGPSKGRGGSLASCEAFGEKFLAAAGCKSVEELRKVDAQTLINLKVGNERMPFQPNVDGYVLPMTPYDAFVTGHIAKVPVMFGSNTEEGFLIPARGSYEDKISAAKAFFGDKYDEFAKLYPTDEAHIDRSLLEVGRDNMFANLRNVAKTMEKVHPAPVFHYFFDQPLVKADGTHVGANHSSELFYVFDNLDWIAKCFPWEPKLELSAYELAHKLCDYWTQFVKYSDPNKPGLPAWPAYDSESDCHLYISADELVGRPNPDAERIAFVDSLRK